MIRKNLKSGKVGLNNNFKYRGEAQTRIETLSDAVFAIAIALLILSSSVPERFDELLISLQDVIPFGFCITLLMLIWFQHYIFFIRYGLQDAKIVFLNTLLLFLILFYVYPLKFLFRVLYKLSQAIITQNQALFNDLFSNVLKPEDGPTLMIIYGFGASLIFLTIAIMYMYALKKKRELQLSPSEQFDTKTSIYNNLIMALVPILSSLIAIIGVGNPSKTFAISGFTYYLYMVFMPLYNFKRGKTRKKNGKRSHFMIQLSGLAGVC